MSAHGRYNTRQAAAAAAADQLIRFGDVSSTITTLITQVRSALQQPPPADAATMSFINASATTLKQHHAHLKDSFERMPQEMKPRAQRQYEEISGNCSCVISEIERFLHISNIHNINNAQMNTVQNTIPYAPVAQNVQNAYSYPTAFFNPPSYRLAPVPELYELSRHSYRAPFSYGMNNRMEFCANISLFHSRYLGETSL